MAAQNPATIGMSVFLLACLLGGCYVEEQEGPLMMHHTARKSTLRPATSSSNAEATQVPSLAADIGLAALQLRACLRHTNPLGQKAAPCVVDVHCTHHGCELPGWLVNGRQYFFRTSFACQRLPRNNRQRAESSDSGQAELQYTQLERRSRERWRSERRGAQRDPFCLHGWCLPITLSVFLFFSLSLSVFLSWPWLGARFQGRTFPLPPPLQAPQTPKLPKKKRMQSRKSTVHPLHTCYRACEPCHFFVAHLHPSIFAAAETMICPEHESGLEHWLWRRGRVGVTDPLNSRKAPDRRSVFFGPR